MRVGGHSPNGLSNSVELIDLDTSSGPSLDCITASAYPFPVYGAAGGVLNGKPTVCGGYDGEKDRQECYRYESERNEWILVGEMSQAKRFMGSAYDQDWGLVMVGGISITDIAEMTNDGTVFESLTPTPIATSQSCLVIIDEKTLFMAGGHTGR